jgi:hypothetical protein
VPNFRVNQGCPWVPATGATHQQGSPAITAAWT